MLALIELGPARLPPMRSRSVNPSGKTGASARLLAPAAPYSSPVSLMAIPPTALGAPSIPETTNL